MHIYTGCPTVATRNPYEISLANFTVASGANHLSRPVAGGSVESGYLQTGQMRGTNLTLNTETGEYKVMSFDQMYIQYPEKYGHGLVVVVSLIQLLFNQSFQSNVL